jgi:hypothetical protein
VTRRARAVVAFVLEIATTIVFLESAGYADEKGDVKTNCSNAYVAGQRLRNGHQLRSARAELITCSAEQCPAVLKRECAEWLVDVERRMPSIVVHARSADGSDVSDAQLFVDGTKVLDRLTGASVEVDPGDRVLRIAHQGKTIERVIVVNEGEKLRVVAIDLGPSQETRPREKEAPASPSPSGERPVPWPVYVLGGIGVVGLAGFGVFGISGLAQQRDELDACRPACAPERVDMVRTKYVVAYSSLAVGSLFLGAAAYFYFTRPTVNRGLPPSADLFVDVEHGGAQLRFARRF